MSLVNDILKELEKGGNKSAPIAPHEAIMMGKQRGSKKPTRWVNLSCIAVIILSVASLSFAYLYKQNQKKFTLKTVTRTIGKKSVKVPPTTQKVVNKQAQAHLASMQLPQRPSQGALMQAMAHDLDLLFGFPLYERDMAGDLMVLSHSKTRATPVTTTPPKQQNILRIASQATAGKRKHQPTLSTRIDPSKATDSAQVAATWLDIDSENTIKPAGSDLSRAAMDVDARAYQVITAVQSNNTEKVSALLTPLLNKEGREENIDIFLQALVNKDKPLIATRAIRFFLEKATRHDPDIYKISARFLLNQGETLQASNILQRIAPSLESSPDYYSLEAYALLKLKKYRNSIAIYKDLLSLDADQASWWLGLGVDFQGVHESEHALEAYRMALKNSTDATTYRYYLKDKINEILAGQT